MLMTGWKRKSFGLDISEGKFRIVQLSKIGNKIKITSYNKIDVPEEYFKDGKIVEINKSIQLLHQLISQINGRKVSTKYVNACLAETKTFIKLINISSQEEGEDLLEKIINEARKHIPYPLEDVYFDWQYTSEKDQILIGICPKEIVENYQDFLKKSGLIPVALEIEAAAIVRSILPIKEKNNKPVMILDLGANRSSLILYYKEVILFTLSIPVSGKNMTSTIAEKLNLPFEEAKEIKHTLGINKTKAQGYLYQLLTNDLEKITQRIREAKYFYSEHFYGHQELSDLYLTGGGSELPGITEFIKAEVNLDVKIANPLINISGSVKLPADDISSYTTAIGLALRNFFLSD